MVIGLGIINLYWAFTMWNLSDAGAYWHAALRLREGAALYPAVANIDASDVYRYAPWFAWLTVPFTYLPQQVAGALWSVVLLGASVLAVVPMLRARAWLPVAFFLPILVGISAGGNVQALMIAGLVHGVERRSGPLWIGVATSLKISPILLVAVYAGRGQWGRVAATVAIAALLWAPVLLYDLRGYSTEAGQAATLVSVPILWVLVVGAAVGVTMRLARSRFVWLTAATAVVLAVPRLFVYDVTYLMVGTAKMTPGRARE
ncbi:MAG: glycosyltransferase 87 family protein [Chloroflexota bacterium]